MVWKPKGLPNPRVFMDVAVGGRDVGRITFELFADELPITTENFRALCTGETGLGYWLKPRWYKHTNFYRVIPGFMCQGGDFNYGQGQMGESIYGQHFRSERFVYSHSRRGILSMAMGKKNDSNSSNFFITFNGAKWLDGKHVAFGQVESGWHVLDAIESAGSESGKTKRPVEIFQCGELLPRSFRKLTVEQIDVEGKRLAAFERMVAKGEINEEHIPQLYLPDNAVVTERPDVLPQVPYEEIVPLEVYRKYKLL